MSVTLRRCNISNYRHSPAQQLIEHYPGIKENITGHSDVAPGRKTDPGPHFNWSYYRALLAK